MAKAARRPLSKPNPAGAGQTCGAKLPLVSLFGHAPAHAAARAARHIEAVADDLVEGDLDARAGLGALNLDPERGVLPVVREGLGHGHRCRTQGFRVPPTLKRLGLERPHSLLP